LIVTFHVPSELGGPTRVEEDGVRRNVNPRDQGQGRGLQHHEDATENEPETTRTTFKMFIKLNFTSNKAELRTATTSFDLFGRRNRQCYASTTRQEDADQGRRQ